MLTWLAKHLNSFIKYLIMFFISSNSQDDSPNKLTINFKFTKHKSIRLSVDINSNIKQVKEIICKKIHILPDEVAIIFAGKELSDDLVLSSCDLANESLLHVIELKCKKGNKSNTDDTNDLLSMSIKQLTVTDTNVLPSTSSSSSSTSASTSTSSNKKNYFTVYCSNCKSIQFGRIRVRCSECKESAVILDRDPSSWQDVLSTKCITGKCFNSDKSCSKLDFVHVEFYFKCSSCQVDNSDCVPLHQVRINSRNIPCLSCQDVCERIFLFDCTVKHSLCLECFTSYCLSKLNERQFILDNLIGYTLECPSNCENSKINVTHHFHFLGEDAYMKYQRFAAEEYTLASGGIFCPKAQCGAGILPGDEGILCDKIICDACSYIFCSRCRNEYHLGPCETLTNAKGEKVHGQYVAGATNSNELDSYYEILRISKPCPKCQTPTERDGGCMHITCTRSGCSFEWCWICESEWTRNCMASHWFD